MRLAALFLAADTVAHRHGRCLLDPPGWTYALTFGEWADYTIKPVNPGNLWWRFGQWVSRHG